MFPQSVSGYNYLPSISTSEVDTDKINKLNTSALVNDLQIGTSSLTLNGILRYNSSSNVLEYYNGSGFQSLVSGSTPNQWTTSGNDISNNNSGNVIINSAPSVQKLSVAGNMNITTGNSYMINNSSILSSTTLASSVTSSSLTSVGTSLAIGNISLNSGTNTLSNSNASAFNIKPNSSQDVFLNWTNSNSIDLGVRYGSSLTTNWIALSTYSTANSGSNDRLVMGNYYDVGNIAPNAACLGAHTYNFGTWATLYIDPVAGGKVRIGSTTSATQELSISGSVDVSSGNGYYVNNTQVLAGSSLRMNVSATDTIDNTTSNGNISISPNGTGILQVNSNLNLSSGKTFNINGTSIVSSSNISVPPQVVSMFIGSGISSNLRFKSLMGALFNTNGTTVTIPSYSNLDFTVTNAGTGITPSLNSLPISYAAAFGTGVINVLCQAVDGGNTKPYYFTISNSLKTGFDLLLWNMSTGSVASLNWTSINSTDVVVNIFAIGY